MKFKILLIALLCSFFSWSQIIYQDNFGTTAISTKPYTGTPTTSDVNLNTFSWTTSAANFGSLAGNGGGTSASLSLSNSSGTPTMTFTFNVAAGYELSVTQFDFWRVRSTTGAQNWAMTINGTSVGAGTIPTTGALLGATNVSTPINGLTGTITVVMTYSGASGMGTCRLDDFTLYGFVTSTAPCTTPTSQASTIANANTTTTTTDLSWSPGATAGGSIVVIRPTATANALPVNGTNYIPNLAWASAGQIDVNNRVFYRSNGASVTGITGLTPGTQYTATVYAYNGSGTNICYNTTSPESLTFYTLAAEATAHAASFTCATVSTTQINLTFSAANTIGGNGYIILYREGAAPTGVPTDGAFHAAGTVFGDAIIHGYTSNIGTTTTYSVTGLNGGTTYFFSLVPYSSVLSIAETLNYRTLATIPVSTCATSPAPEMNVRGIVGSNPTIPDGDITPQGTDNTLFATVVVGNNQAKNFRIENTGNAVLNITSIYTNGGHQFDFVISGITLPTTIPAGGFLDFTVTFTPLAAGTRTTTLFIDNNDSNENPYNFTIQGNGTITPSIEMNILGNGQSIPDNSIYPVGTNHTAFGVATVGVTTVVRTFTIENLGSTALTLTGAPYVVVSGTHASMFTVTAQPSSNSIAGSSSLTFQITFNPTAPGAKYATVSIANNDSDENPYNFNISGTAKGTNNIYVYGNGNDVIKGTITTSLTNLTNFGSVAVPTGVQQSTFVITNLSGASVYLSNATITGADATMFTVISQPTNNALGNGNSTSFTINFTPTTTGIKNATVTFNTYTDAARTIPESIDPVFTFAISGNGIVFSPCTNNAVQTLFIQDFETTPATPTYNYSYTTNGTVNIAGGTFDNGSGPRNAFIGARAFQMAGIGTTATGNVPETSVVTFSGINVSQYTNINLSLKVGAFRTGTTQGLDVNEFIQVETSIDGGVNWSTESVLRAYSNSRWDFNATGVFNAYYTGTNNGATIDTRNGGAELPNGIATYYVRSLPASSNLLIRITLVVDRSDEIWAIDDVRIEAQLPVATTWNGTTWSAGAPNSTTKAIFDGTYNTATNGNVQACECEIRSGRTVTIASNGFIESQSNITNNGTLNVLDDGSLVQINDDAINTGTISVERIASLRRSDYVYWSSPIEGFNVNNISPLSPTWSIFRWNTTASNTNGGLGTWQNAAGSTMNAGEGYILRGPNNFDDASFQNLTVNFTGGRQNNGIINVPISRGAMTAATLGTYTSANGVAFTVNDDNWNLVGNPYPSSIRALDFINANTNIEGAVRLWTHGTLPAVTTNPFYGSFTYNYNPLNDYITHNGIGTVSGPAGFSGFIASGQAFFVLMNEGTAASSTITFNNLMRNRTYTNANFYRASNSLNSSENSEISRIWLDVVNSNNQSVRTLIGYTSEATDGLDRVYDALAQRVNSLNIYSIIDTENYTIQGKSSFSSNDTVQIGLNIPANGNYTLAIGAVDGVFEQGQKIYLEDKLLQIIHDLSNAPYSFNSNEGAINNRFELRYTNPNETLNTTQFENNKVVVWTNNEFVFFKSQNETISDITIYDVLGRVIHSSEKLNTNEFSINKGNLNNQSVIIKIKLLDGSLITRKVQL